MSATVNVGATVDVVGLARISLAVFVSRFILRMVFGLLSLMWSHIYIVSRGFVLGSAAAASPLMVLSSLMEFQLFLAVPGPSFSALVIARLKRPLLTI